MGCSSAETVRSRGWGGDLVAGSLPGGGACGCGCAGGGDALTGLLPGSGAPSVHVRDTSALASVWRSADLSLASLRGAMEGEGYRCSYSRRGGFGVASALGTTSLATGVERIGTRPSHARPVTKDDASHWEEVEAEETWRAFETLADSVVEALRTAPVVECTPLSPPAYANRGSCRDTVEGSDDDCNWQGCAEEKELPSVDDLLAWDAPLWIRDKRREVSGCDEHLEDILHAAWAMLYRDIDLVEWAVCWTFGKGKGGNLVRGIRGSFGETTEIRIRSWEAGGILDDFGDASVPDDIVLGWDIPGFDYINIYGGSEYWQSASAIWCCGRNPDMICVAIDVARILLHELTHYYGLAGDDPNPDEECYGSYVCDSIFDWAMFKRYNTLAETWYSHPANTEDASYAKPCCYSKVEDIVFAAGPTEWGLSSGTAVGYCDDYGAANCDTLAGECGGDPC